jgi:hypothetical protein
LSKLFGSETKVLKSHLDLLLLELFDFEYKNGNRGHAIIVPWVKDEESFQRQAKKRNGLKAA